MRNRNISLVETMMNKSLSFSLVCCCMLASVSQVGLAHQQKAAPQYYLGVTGHFDANQTYANAGSIIDEVLETIRLSKWSLSKAVRSGHFASENGFPVLVMDLSTLSASSTNKLTDPSTGLDACTSRFTLLIATPMVRCFLFRLSRFKTMDIGLASP